MAKCPVCGTDGAYIGLREVKCPNSECKCYDKDSIFKNSSEDVVEAPNDGLDDGSPPSLYGSGNSSGYNPYGPPVDVDYSVDSPDYSGDNPSS